MKSALYNGKNYSTRILVKSYILIFFNNFVQDIGNFPRAFCEGCAHHGSGPAQEAGLHSGRVRGPFADEDPGRASACRRSQIC